MQKSSLRPGTPKPRLSDLLQRRNQTVAQYSNELGITHEAALEMHCVMHGVVKDVAFPVPDVVTKVEIKLDVKETEKAVEKLVAEKKKEKEKAKPVTKNALVDLTDLVHSGRTSTDEE